MIRIFIAICLLSVISCSGNENAAEDVLTEDEMTNILLDIYITEAKVTNYTPHINFQQKKTVFEELNVEILEEHDVTEEELRNSLQYYFKQPEVLDKIYSRVIDSLNLKMQQKERVEE